MCSSFQNCWELLCSFSQSKVFVRWTEIFQNNLSEFKTFLWLNFRAGSLVPSSTGTSARLAGPLDSTLTRPSNVSFLSSLLIKVLAWKPRVEGSIPPADIIFGSKAHYVKCSEVQMSLKCTYVAKSTLVFIGKKLANYLVRLKWYQSCRFKSWPYRPNVEAPVYVSSWCINKPNLSRPHFPLSTTKIATIKSSFRRLVWKQNDLATRISLVL